MIPWDRAYVLEYIDSCIRLWRRVRDERPRATPDYHEAVCYIDAYQSVRASLFGSELPEEADGDVRSS